jgi:hypothetical protein
MAETLKPSDEITARKGKKRGGRTKIDRSHTSCSSSNEYLNTVETSI